MNILYIDANIYLGFYNSNIPEFKKLLASIIELSDKIFFTEQLAFEIDRNKLNIFRQSIDNYLKQVILTATILPEHLDDESSPKLADWNKMRKDLENQISKSNKELTPILDEVLKSISISEDKVSKKLSALYGKAVNPTSDDIRNARFRKEIGNPPGKRADPLGDQLSWEMLLNIISKTKKLWIVSNDKDYFSSHKNVLYLNPVLYNDLMHQNSSLEVKIFNKLSEALRDFSNEEKIKAIPTEKELDEISKSETTDFVVSGSTSSMVYSDNFMTPKPTKCPNCQATDSFTDGYYSPSQYGGGLSLHYLCKNCHLRLDTGDYFD